MTAKVKNHTPRKPTQDSDYQEMPASYTNQKEAEVFK